MEQTGSRSNNPSTNNELIEFDENLFNDEDERDTDSDAVSESCLIPVDYYGQPKEQTARGIIDENPKNPPTQYEQNEHFHDMIEGHRTNITRVHNKQELLNLCPCFNYDPNIGQSVKLWSDLMEGKYLLKNWKARFTRQPPNTSIAFTIDQLAYEEEIALLIAFANESAVCEEVLQRVNYKVTKQTFINVAAMAEGNDKTYITGGGARPSTLRRVVLYEKIRGVTATKRRIGLVEGITLGEGAAAEVVTKKKRKSRAKKRD